MVSLLTENRISLNELARQENVAPSTVWRWVLRGIQGVQLEALRIGGRRYTSREAFERFVERTTAAVDGDAPTVRTNRQREAAITRAERELDAAGI